MREFAIIALVAPAILAARVSYDYGKIAGWHECNAAWKAAL